MALLIGKIIVFGVRRSHVWLAKNKRTHNVSPFSTDFSQEASYFFENETGQAATVNGARYHDTITRFFLPKLDDIDVADMWFQQDDATCQWNNSITAHFLYFFVSVIRIGPLDRVIYAIRFLVMGLFEVKGLRRQSRNHTCITRGN